MKFSIRDLLLVTMIVALVAGWWVDRSSLAKENKQLSKQLKDSASYYGFFGQAREGAGVDTTGFLPNSSAPAPNPPKD